MPIPLDTKVKNYDGTLVGDLLQYVENPDSVGYINGLWYSPRYDYRYNAKKNNYDVNNYGIGIDRYKNQYISDGAYTPHKDSQGRDYLSVAEERNLRHHSIANAETSYNNRLDFAQRTFKSNKVPSEMKKALTLSAIYNLGPGTVSDELFEDRKLMDAFLNGTDLEYSNQINKYYTEHNKGDRGPKTNKFIEEYNPKKYISSKGFFSTLGSKISNSIPSLPPIGGTRAEGGSLNQPKYWNDLSMAEKAEMIRTAIRNGITNLSDIKAKYNEFAKGGNLYGDGDYLDIAKKYIRENENFTPTKMKDGVLKKAVGNRPAGTQLYAIGYGFNDSGFWGKYPGDITKHYANGITKEQAEAELDWILRHDTVPTLKKWYGSAWDRLSNNQKAALIDTYYQSPISVARGTKFHTAIMAGDPLAVDYLGVKGYDSRNKKRRALFGSIKDIELPEFQAVDLSDYPAFVASNPEAFNMPLESYQQPIVAATPPEPLVEAAKAYSAEELKKQEQMQGLKNFGMVMGMLNPDSNSPYINAINMLTGNVHGLGGNLFDTGGPTDPPTWGQPQWKPLTLNEIAIQGEQAKKRRNQRVAKEVAKKVQSIEGEADRHHRMVADSRDKEVRDNTNTQRTKPESNYSREYNTEKGAEQQAKWRQEHPVLSTWGDVTAATPLVVASLPVLGTAWTGLSALGEAAAATTAGQAITSALAPVATAATTTLPYVNTSLATLGNAGLTSYFGAEGINRAAEEGGISPMTTLEIAPILQMTRPATKMVTQTIENMRHPLGRPVIPDKYLTIKPNARIKVGDVEIDNPNLYYRQGSKEIVDDYLSTGTVRGVDSRNIWGDSYANNPIFQKGSLFWGNSKPGLLVSNGKMSYADVMSRPISEEAALRGGETLNWGIPAEPLNSSNTSAYIYTPGYGFRKVSQDVPISWQEAKSDYLGMNVTPLETPSTAITAENAASITPTSREVNQMMLPSLDIDGLRRAIEQQITENQWKGLLRGEEDVFNYLGSEKHINRIMESGVPRERATKIAQDMKDNAMATDRAIDYTGGEGAYHNVGEYDNGFFNHHRRTLNPKYTVMKGLDEQSTYENVIHELGGHGATLGYRPGSYSNINEKAAKWYEDAMTEWSPYHKEVYEHNSSLKPIRKPEYIDVKDPHIEYLEGVDEYSARARAANIDNSNRRDFSELYKYFTKESVDKLKNSVWGLIPFGIGLTGYGLFNNQEALGGKINKRRR